MKQESIWKSRIVEQREMNISELTENPKNWREHSTRQSRALKAVFEDVGIVQSVIYNQQTKRLIDGHLRVELAKKNNEKVLPVTIVDLSEDEENLILATFDPIGAMAESNEEKIKDLLGHIKTENNSINELLSYLKKETNNIISEYINMPEFKIEDKSAYRQIIVNFNNEEDISVFSEKIDIKINKNTKSIYFPRQEIDKVANIGYKQK